MTDGQSGGAGIIGPIIGAAVGLGMLAATVKITKDALDNSKQKEKLRPHPKRQIYEPYPTTPRIESKDRVERGLNRMLGR